MTKSHANLKVLEGNPMSKLEGIKQVHIRLYTELKPFYGEDPTDEIELLQHVERAADGDFGVQGLSKQIEWMRAELEALNTI